MLMVGEVERQAEQVVAQRLGDELVDLVAEPARVMPRTMAPAASSALSAPSSLNASGLRKASIRRRCRR